MKRLIIILALAGVASAQVVVEPLNGLVMNLPHSSVTLSSDATCALGVATTGPCPPSGVAAALAAAALNMPKLTRTSNTVASVSTGIFTIHKQPTTITAAITLTNVTRIIASIAYSAPTTTITFTTSDPTLRTGDTLVYSATPTKTPAASCSALLAGGGFVMTVTSGTTATAVAGNLTTCAGAYTSGDITGGLNASASGTIKVSGDPTTGGVVKFSIPVALGMIYSCTGQSLCPQETAATYSDVPIGDLTVTGGVITAAVDARGALGAAGLRAGDGISIPESTATATVAVDASVCRVDGTNCPTGSAAAVYVPIPMASCNSQSTTAISLLNSATGAFCLGGPAGFFGVATALTSSLARIQVQIPIAYSSVDLQLQYANQVSSTANINFRTACLSVGDANSPTPSWNSAQTITPAAGTTYQLGTITGLTMTGCAVNRILLIEIAPQAGGADYVFLSGGTLKFKP